MTALVKVFWQHIMHSQRTIFRWSFYIYYFLFIQLLFITHKRNGKSFLHLWQSLSNRQPIIFIMSSFSCKLWNQIFFFLKMLEMPFQILFPGFALARRDPCFGVVSESRVVPWWLSTAGLRHCQASFCVPLISSFSWLSVAVLWRSFIWFRFQTYIFFLQTNRLRHI